MQAFCLFVETTKRKFEADKAGYSRKNVKEVEQYKSLFSFLIV